MTLILLAYLGGILTIASPCILPVLPFVFARADKPFVRSGLPMLAGMAITFALVATLAAVAGGWAVAANEYGRVAAIVLLAFFGITLLFPSLSDHLTRPLVALGARMSQSADQDAKGGIVSSFILGIATGLLWAPCAGPVLGLILTGAALQGANTGTTLLLLAYALGAATSLALALLVGGRVFATMKRSLGISEWVRRGAGALVLVAVAAIAFGADTGFLTQVSLASTTTLEQGLIDRLKPPVEQKTASNNALPVLDDMPSLDGATTWLNAPPLTAPPLTAPPLTAPPLTAEGLKGKVVVVDFWTYSCINCLRAIPYVEAWAQKYKNDGLVVIGVHAPEFAFERNEDNVRKAIASLKITYPVAIDNDYTIWRAFGNQYWPAHYFIDAKGRIRHEHFGEGDYGESEHVIQQLLAEAGAQHVAGGVVTVSAAGAEAASDTADVQSPETYIGFNRAEKFASPGGAINDKPHDYTVGSSLQLNQWGLTGNWTVAGDDALSNVQDGGIVYRFHARDLHLVLGPSADGKPVHFRVTIDGKTPGDNRGSDIDTNGDGVVTGQRLYQLIRQAGPVADHTFQIQFLDPGVQAFAFTFG